jgi:Spy/CpxP family protein refolding chaperone
MKKIPLGIIAVTLAFSSIAQSSNTTTDNPALNKKETQQKHFNGGENLVNLDLTNAQKAEIKTINASFRKQMQDLNKQGNLTVDQQKQKREALVSEHKAKVAAILTPQQRQQAEILSKDFRGNRDGAGRDRFGDMAKDLNLTPDQSAKMASINSTFKTKLQEIRQNTSLSQDEKREQMKSLMKQHRSDMEALLTNDQKEQLKSRQKNRPNRATVK